MKNLLLSALLLLYCVACQPQEQGGHVPAATRQDGAVQQPVRPAASTAPAVSSDSAEQAMVVNLKPFRLKSLAAGDSIGPWPLELSPNSPTQVRIKLNDEYTSVDTLNSHLLIITALEEPMHVLYRAKTTDTTWIELGGLFQYQQGDQQKRVEFQQVNLDGESRPEILLTFTSADYGSGSGSNYASIYLLDVTAYPPQLLLRAKTSFIVEILQGYAAMHGDTLADDEVYTGYERTVRLRPHELVLGTIKASSRKTKPEQRSELTQLPAGRYRYQHGKVFRVKQ